MSGGSACGPDKWGELYTPDRHLIERSDYRAGDPLITLRGL
jgi:hypothetical protein